MKLKTGLWIIGIVFFLIVIFFIFYSNFQKNLNQERIENLESAILTYGEIIDMQVESVEEFLITTEYALERISYYESLIDQEIERIEEISKGEIDSGVSNTIVSIRSKIQFAKNKMYSLSIRIQFGDLTEEEANALKVLEFMETLKEGI